MNRRALWVKGETEAVDFLKNKGYKIIKTNYKTVYGEADIIAFIDQTLVFVEVKSRKDVKFGRPIEAVNSAKIRKYVLLATEYTKSYPNYNVRFDIIELLDEQIIHTENAFDASDAAKYKKR